MVDDQTPRQGFPLVLPKPFGFEEAVRRGRAIRRRRTAGAGAGFMTLVLGVLGAVAIQDRPSDSKLNFTDRDQITEQRQPREPNDWHTRGLASPSSAPAPSPAEPPASGPSRSGADAVGGYVRQNDPPPVDVPDPPPPPPDPLVEKPPMQQREQSEPEACAPVINPPERNWCTRLDIARTGEAVTFNFSVCRDISAQTPGGLTFRTVQRADFRVRNEQGQTLWTWSKGQRFAPVDSDSITVQPGGCVYWSLDWTPTDENNRPLTSGTYTVYGWSKADGFETRSPESGTFEL